jgi:hypothetical protein
MVPMDMGNKNNFRLPFTEDSPDRINIERTSTCNTSVKKDGGHPIKDLYGINTEPGDIKIVLHKTGSIYNHKASPVLKKVVATPHNIHQTIDEANRCSINIFLSHAGE